MRRLAFLWTIAFSCAALAEEHVWPAGAREPPRHTDLAPVVYRLAIENPHAHLAAVTLRISGYGAEPLDVAMPAWTPGAYHLIVPAKNVQRMSAEAGGKPLRIRQLDRQTWRILDAPAGGTVTLKYFVYLSNASVTESVIAPDHAEIDGFDTFLYVVGNLGTPCTLEVAPWRDWTIETGMPLEGGTYRARDYDVLIDSPLLWGRLKVRTFQDGGRPHRVVWSGESDGDIDRFTGETQRIVAAVRAMFGGDLPYSGYWFLYRFMEGGGGGLEHLNSTRINGPSRGYREPDVVDRYLRVTAHEFVHTWNVKRIRPASLGPFDYTREQTTPFLWFAEGFTSYLGDLALRHAGLWSEERYLHTIAAAIQQERESPAASWMSAEQASFVTWHKAQNPEGVLDYYTKGHNIALVLEMELRRRTGGRRGVVDVMRKLWDEFRATGEAFGEDGIERAVEAVGGGELGDFFARHVAGTTPLPFEDALATVGLVVQPKPGKKGAWLGVEVPQTGDARVAGVVKASPAEAAGLRKGDVILALGDKRVTGLTFIPAVQALGPRQRVTVTLYRDDKLLRLDATLGERVLDTDPNERRSFRNVRIRVTPAPNATAAQVAARRAWLGE